MKIRYQRGLKRSLQTHFGTGFSRLEQFLKTLPSTLPHTSLSEWSRRDGAEPSGSHLQGGTSNRVINIAISYSLKSNGQKYTLTAKLNKERAFGVYERGFVNSIAQEIGRVVDILSAQQSEHLLIGPQEMVDAAVANFLQGVTGITDTDINGIIKFLKELAQQSYETKPITYGIVVLNRTESKRHIATFPSDIIDKKRFQSMTDGYNTALLLDSAGKIIRLIGLDTRGRVGEHFRPTWLDPLADTARTHDALGIALTRSGTLMIAWQGNLLLSYRLGKWTLWYHSENIELIKDGLTRRGTVPRDMGRLASKLYRCALDVSFRKTGALFVALRSPKHIEKLVKGPEQIDGQRRTKGDRALGEWLSTNSVVGAERKILTDLSALDGAIVCDRRGNILSYGSVLLLPRRKGLSQIEGSRSRAAYSASYFGLSIKISSDGGIDVIESGHNLLSL